MTLGKFFEENDSCKKSVTRLVFFVWSVGVLIAWIYISIENKKMMPIDNTIVTTILGLMAGKTAQRYLEAEAAVKTETPAKTT